MRRQWLPVLILPLLAAVLVVAGLLRPPARGSTVSAAPIVGRQAPPIDLQSTDGHRVTLESLRGKTVLVDFFATWCIPCRTEMPAINRLAAAYPSQLAVLAVDKQEPVGDVRSFAQHLRLRFDPLLDADLTVWRRYRVPLQPVSFWIDRSGVIRAIHYGVMPDSFMRREVRLLA